MVDCYTIYVLSQTYKVCTGICTTTRNCLVGIYEGSSPSKCTPKFCFGEPDSVIQKKSQQNLEQHNRIQSNTTEFGEAQQNLGQHNGIWSISELITRSDLEDCDKKVQYTNKLLETTCRKQLFYN